MIKSAQFATTAKWIMLRQQEQEQQHIIDSIRVKLNGLNRILFIQSVSKLCYLIYLTRIV